MKLCLKCQRKVTGNCYANRRKFTRSTWFTVHFPFLAEREKRIGDNCEMRIVAQRILRFLRFFIRRGVQARCTIRVVCFWRKIQSWIRKYHGIRGIKGDEIRVTIYFPKHSLETWCYSIMIYFQIDRILSFDCRVCSNHARSRNASYQVSFICKHTIFCSEEFELLFHNISELKF